jgi:hypothetical protein
MPGPWSAAAWRIAGLVLAIGAVVTAAYDRRVLFDLPASGYRASVERFAAGPPDVTVDAGSAGATVPYILPGPSDGWAGSAPHALRLTLARPPTRRLRLELRTVEIHDVAPPRLAVRADGVARVVQTEPGTGLPPPHGERGTRRRYDVRIAPRAGPGPWSLSVTNEAGSWVMWERLRLVEEARRLDIAHLARREPLPPASLGALVAGLAVLLPGAVRAGGGRATGPLLALAAAGLALGLPRAGLVGVPPRWLALALPWLCLAAYAGLARVAAGRGRSWRALVALGEAGPASAARAGGVSRAWLVAFVVVFAAAGEAACLVSGERSAFRWMPCGAFVAYAAAILATTALALERLRGAGASVAATFVLFLALYLPLSLPASRNGGDNIWYVPTARSILRGSRASLDGYAGALRALSPAVVWVNDLDADPRSVPVGGRRYMFHPPGTAFMAIPFVPLGDAIYAATENLVERSLQVAELVGKIFAALGVALFWAVASRLTPRRTATFLTLLFGSASLHLSTHGGALWSHNAVLVSFQAALLLLLSGGRRLAWAAAVPLALGFLVRPDQSVAVVVLTAYFLIHVRARWPLFLGAGALVGLGFAAYSQQVYGSLLPHYYWLTARLNAPPGLLWEALGGHAISPNRGLFVYVPTFLFALYGLVRVGARRDGHPLVRYLGFLLVLHWLVVSKWPVWWAGASYGPRAFASVLPVWVLLLAPAIEAIGSRGAPGRAAWTALLFVAVGWSAFVDMRGATDPDVYEWNATPVGIDHAPARLWDWSDWQIFR